MLPGIDLQNIDRSGSISDDQMAQLSMSAWLNFR